MKIVLRTLCGCERILDIPFRVGPPTFQVPYLRRQKFHVVPADGDSCMTDMGGARRTFERTGERGRYGYLLYIEVDR